MSQNQKQQNEDKPMFSLTSKICALLKIGEQGKLDNFFSKIETRLNREISTLEQNKKTKELQFTHQISTIKEDIEDAERNVEETYQKVDLNRLSSNKDMNSYMEVYLEEIENAEESLANLKEKLKSVQEDKEAAIEEIREEITVRRNRIKALKK